MTEQKDSKPAKDVTKESELPESELDQASGGGRAGVGIGSFDRLGVTTAKAKIKVGGVGNWDEDAK